MKDLEYGGIGRMYIATKRIEKEDYDDFFWTVLNGQREGCLLIYDSGFEYFFNGKLHHLETKKRSALEEILYRKRHARI